MFLVMILLAQLATQTMKVESASVPAAPTNVVITSPLELSCDTQLLDVTVTPYVPSRTVTLHMFNPKTGAQIWRDMPDREVSQILMARERKCFCK